MICLCVAHQLSAKNGFENTPVALNSIWRAPLFITAFSGVHQLKRNLRLDAGHRALTESKERCSEEGQPQNKMSLGLEEALATAMRSASAGAVQRESMWVFSSTKKNDFILYLLFALFAPLVCIVRHTRTANMEILLIAIGFCSFKPLSRSQNSVVVIDRQIFGHYASSFFQFDFAAVVKGRTMRIQPGDGTFVRD